MDNSEQLALLEANIKAMVATEESVRALTLREGDTTAEVRKLTASIDRVHTVCERLDGHLHREQEIKQAAAMEEARIAAELAAEAERLALVEREQHLATRNERLKLEADERETKAKRKGQVWSLIVGVLSAVAGMIADNVAGVNLLEFLK